MLLVFDRSGFMTLATGDMKRTKRIGPRTEPWGTSVNIVVLGEDDESILTKAGSQMRANPGDDIARQTKSMLKSVESVLWSRISNAADMSRAVRIVIFPESMVSMMSFVSEQSSLGRVEFAIGRLQRAETGRYGYMREETSQ